MLKQLSSLGVRQPPDCLDWSPTDESILASGLYQINSDSTHVGGVEVFKLNNDHFESVARFEHVGIFHVQFLKSDEPEIAAISTDGEFLILSLQGDQLVMKSGQKCSDHTLTCFDIKESDSSNMTVVCGDSQGTLSILRNCESDKLIESTWTGHRSPYTSEGAEVWAVAHDVQSEHILYSGGDDSLLKVWDTRSLSTPANCIKSHQAGVTVIHPLNTTPAPSLITGSYDENIRSFDLRNPTEPQWLLPLGGGVWHLDFHEHKIAAACMYGGFCVLETTPQWQSPQMLLEHRDHGSELLYDIRWHPSGALIASCTFYGQKLYLHQCHSWNIT